MRNIKEEVYSYFKESGTRPLKVDEIEQALDYSHSEDFKQLVIALNELEQEGSLVRTRKNRFGLPQKMNLVRGKIQMNKKGFAFLIPEDEEEQDIYLHYTDLNTAMNNDVVLVRLEKRGDDSHRPEGTVVR
ncbi:MAG TPA: ribonuclease R, partial [Pseudogracilibacillus sp.]|nr:ribonuclease R [Pseudogracilibacillus sp.]